jgi:hypothetical protein
MREALGQKMHLERVENLVSTGRPDVDVMCAGLFTAVELKSIPRWPARKSTPALGAKGPTQVQRNWHMMWNRNGGRSLVVVGVDATKEVLALHGRDIDQINAMTRDELQQAALAAGWHGLESLLKARDWR